MNKKQSNLEQMDNVGIAEELKFSIEYFPTELHGVIIEL